MLKLDTEINLDFGKFFHWWWSELSFLVPVSLRAWLGTTPRYLILSPEGDGFAVCLQDETGSRLLAHWTLDETGSQQRDALLADTPNLSEVIPVLRLKPHQGLTRTLRLPLAAEENLLQVVGFEMDRMTPFKGDQVYFDARIITRSTPERQLTAQIWLTPRERLDRLIEELATWGWQPALVDLEGSHRPGTCNLLPSKYRPARNPWPGYLNLTLGFAALALLAVMAALPAWSSYRQIEGLEQDMRRVSKVAKEVDQLRQEAEKLQQEARFLQHKKRTEPVVSDLLEELSRVIPDNTWLNGLQYNEHKVVMQGQSPSASSLIELIEASPHFRNTSFVSPVTKDLGSGLERFQIASEVLNGRFAEDTHSPAGQ
jgi:general secretion pathway protein L